ncbi:kinesin-like protein KIF26B isoform X1 [Alosa sapidissima]|uniref:kinesin-like protein KIF26B isoform X1 n=1 Tax=Alosa sapidissima TaxID=34773 RepID=UPI001C0966E0|nr:kinesin-like protein KIF26B isoform X1 [Alosa sapidissima]
MTSLSGHKEKSGTRSRKYGMTDTSPTKSASFSPETWYRKAYEESRTGSRPAPEGAGSMPGSSGTPSPGSGTSSPGSFSGSPGTISPGIGTGSPGSLGGSPGFGTGSPGSGSGSSPGSDRGIWCENCNARLVELKRQALKLLIPGPYSSKDPSFGLLLHDKLQVPNSTRKAWTEQESRCPVCATHLSQLKQEAVHMVLTLDQCDVPPGSPPSLASLGGVRVPSANPNPARDWAFLPATYHSSPSSSSSAAVPSMPVSGGNSTGSANVSSGSSSGGGGISGISGISGNGGGGGGGGGGIGGVHHHQGYPKHGGAKPNSLGVSSAPERRNGSLSHAGKAGTAGTAQTPLQTQLLMGTASASTGANSNVLSSVALATHQYLEGSWSMTRANGVTLYPYKISQMVPEGNREGLTEAALNRYNADRPTSHSTHSTPAPPPPAVTTVPSSGTSAAASFFARAAQKLNLSSKKRKQRPAAPVASDPPLFPTNFSGILQVSPPPAPPCLLRAVNKVKDNPGLGKVKVMLRICPASPPETAESSSFLKVDPRKKQVTIMDPASNTQPNAAQKRSSSSQVPPKMFAFDAAFPHDASQAEVCAGTVAEVIQSVVNGADGCVFCFGHSKLGKSYTMIGRDDSTQSLGIVPCAISWLFKLINERKEKTGARFSVRVSAVEVWGKDENLKDLLSEVATGSLQDGQSPGVYLCEDPICGMQLQNQSELRAPTAEKAAFFLDAAIASRYSSKPDYDEEEHRNSHMLFTLHIYQYRMEKSGKGGMSGGRSRLHLIDLGSCVKVLSKTRDSTTGLCLSLSALGNVILALVNGSKHIPYKDSKLTMLLRESLGNMNCRTTMIAHISASPSNFSETLSTLQIASRVLRMKKKKAKVSVQYTSSSSGGESSCEEGRMRRPTQLRTFHSRNVVDPDMPLLHLSSDHDDYSSSEQSCDTVIYVGPNGSALSDKELTDNEGPPEFVPIIPSIHKNKAESAGAAGKSGALSPQKPPLAACQLPLLQAGLTPVPVQAVQPLHSQALAPVPEEGAEAEKPEKDCLKCNTFAELQERLECIDGSEEVTKFPFEEVPACRATGKVEPVPAAEAALQGHDPRVAEPSTPKRISNDQQLEEIREAVEEAELAQSIIESLTQSSAALTSSRSVTGSSSGGVSQIVPLQRAKSSSLHDSRESISGASGSEGKPRSMGSPRLGIASLTKTAEYKPPLSPSQRSKVYTQKCVMPGTPPSSSSSHNLTKDGGQSSTESLLIQPESRTSPVGVSMGSAETLCDDAVPQLPLDGGRKDAAAAAATATATVLLQRPLETNGEDELVFTLVEELSMAVSGGVGSGGGGGGGVMLENGRPTSIISFSSDCSVQALASGSRPVSIISSISEDLDRYAAVTAISTTATATISEANLARFLPTQGRMDGDPVAGVTAGMTGGQLLPEPSRRSSISSWLSEVSTGSDGEQSCHSFVAQHCFGQGEAMADPQLPEEAQVDSARSASGRKTPESDTVLVKGDKPNEKSTPTKERLSRMSPTISRTTVSVSTVQTLSTTSGLVPFKTTITVHPCVAVKPMIIQDFTSLSSPTKTAPHKDGKCPLMPLSSDILFDDPWMKRDCEDFKVKDIVCEVKPEKRLADSVKARGGVERRSSSSGEAVCSPDTFKRVVDGCEMVLAASDGTTAAVFSADILRTGSLPRGWHRLNRQDDLEDAAGLRYASGEYRGLGVTTSTPCSPRATLERRGSSSKQGLFARQKGIPPLPPIRKSSLDQKNRAGPLHTTGSMLTLSFLGSTPDDLGGNGKQKGSGMESSRLFSAKLEQLASRTNSLGRSHGGHYDCHSLERAESLTSMGSKGGSGNGGRDTTMPRSGRSLTRGSSVPSPTNGNNNNVPQSPVKGGQSKISAVSKLLMASPKARSLSTSSTKTLSFSTKSLPQSVNRSSSLPPNGKNQSAGSWSTQSLSRSRGSGLASKLPLRAVNGRISELLQGSGGSRAGHARGASDSEERGGGSGGGPQQGGEERPVVHTLPSPYSKITAPRRPHRCSSGHASDNSSVLSGELPPAMGKTALFYHSGGSSGYESMIRDSEATGSTSSAQDSMSENSSSVSGRRSLKNSKKRNNTGTQRRRLIPNLNLDTASPVRKPMISPGVRWVDGPLRPAQRGLAEPFEIKVYEIDDVERLQRRRMAGNKEVVYFSAKLKILENRQQRISEVRAKYDWLKKELELTKQHLMLEPEKWTTEFDLQQTFEVDSLEYLEALEIVTDRLETRVNFCKAHLMMITCFDVTCRRR